jgi:hypothetical protein
MLTHSKEEVHRYTQTALIQMASEDPFIRSGKGFKTAMGLKKKTNEVRASYPDIRTNKSVLNFGKTLDQCCQLKTEYTDSFIIENRGKHVANIEILVIPSKLNSNAYTLNFEPSTATIKKHKEVKINVTVKINHGGSLLQELFCINVKDGKQVPLILRASGERAVFGTPIDILEQEKLPDGTFIPKILLEMENVLIQMGGLDQTGIFRLAPDEYDSDMVKNELNAGTFTKCKDVNCIANLIKVWFRELPKKVLDSISVKDMLSMNNTEECLALYESIPYPEKGVLTWLFDLMCKVVMNEEVNKMTVKNCSIVLGPNMFDTERASAPLEALMLSNKSGSFISNMLAHRLKTMYNYNPKM